MKEGENQFRTFEELKTKMEALQVIQREKINRRKTK